MRAEDEGRETHFTIDLVKKPGDMLGVQIDETEGIRVGYIGEGGLVHNWNKEKFSESPELVVKIGYSIIDVNGVKGMDGMKSISSNTDLRITISRLCAVTTENRFP